MNGAREPMPDGEARRNLAILFSDLCGSTGIGDALDPEDYRELLAELREVYRRVVSAHGGIVAQFVGDGMLALFGYPEANEGDGRRAVEAALDLHDAVHRLGGGSRWGGAALRLHSGIHAGLVLLLEGDGVSGRFEVVGAATNIASRLCNIAGEGQILVGESALGPERHLFHTSERSQQRLKGKDLPVATIEILGRAPVRSRYAASVRGGLTPFVGRGEEMARLEAGLDAALAGTTGFVQIEGPPGVGKTRLAEEALCRIAGRAIPIHRGECEAAAEPLRPFLQIARSLVGLDRHLSGRQAEKLVASFLAQLDPEHAPPEATLLRILALAPDGEGKGATPVETLRTLFAAAARRSPLILFIDDWHAADDASRELLAALRGTADRSLFILVTARPGRSGDALIGESALLRLSPLGADEIDAAVAALMPSASSFVRRSIRDRSGGNPLYIEELCHSLATRERTAHRDQGSAWLDTLIESRFARLPAPQADLVRAAAVIGTIIPVWLFELITGCGEDDPLVAALADQDFVFPGEREGTLRFKHGITREAIYNCVGLNARRALHLRIAKALSERWASLGEDEPHEALAYHYGAAGAAAPTAHHAELAGDRALAASALDRAQVQYKTALDALDELPPTDEIGYRWGRIAQRFGLAGVFDPSRDQLSVFERAVERARMRGDDAALAWAEYWLGYINYALGESGAAIIHCQRALEAALRVDDDPLIVQIRATLGQARVAACDYAEGLRLLDEAIEVKRRHRTGARPPIGFAYSTACKGFALADLGRFAEAQACYDEALDAIGGARDEVIASILTQRSAVSLWQGEPEDALRFALEAERAAERAHSLYCYAMGRALAGYARWIIDRDPAAPPAIAEATAWLEDSGRGQFTSLNYGWLADVMVATGRIAEARRFAARAVIRARKQDRFGEAMAWRAMARAEAQAGRSEASARYLRRAFRAAQGRGSPHEMAATRLCEAQLALAGGESAAAEDALADAIQRFAALDMNRQLRRVASMMREDIPPNR